MRRSDIKVGEVYAVSDQRDAVIGSTFWSFRPCRVLELNVQRPENEKGEKTQRTDGTLVEVLDLNLKRTGETEVLRTRQVKGFWQEHLDQVEANQQAAIEEAEQEQVETEQAQAQVENLTHGILSQAQVAQVTPAALHRAETYHVDSVGQGLFRVAGPRQDALVLVIRSSTHAHLMQTQEDKGFHGLIAPQVQVIEGPTDISYQVAAAITANKEGWV